MLLLFDITLYIVIIAASVILYKQFAAANTVYRIPFTRRRNLGAINKLCWLPIHPLQSES